MSDDVTTGGAGADSASLTTLLAAAIAIALVVAFAVGRIPTSGAAPPSDPEVPAAPAPTSAAPAGPAPRPAPAPSAPDPEPSLPAGARHAADVIAEEYGITDLAASGLRVEDDGLELILGIFVPGYDHIADEGEWRAWTRNFRDRPSRVPGFHESAFVILDPLFPCIDFHRQIIGVSTGIGGEAGRRIEAALLEATGPRPFPFLGSDEDPWPRACSLRGEDGWWMAGYVLDEVLAVPCGMPGRDLRCYVVTRWFYLGGVRNHWYAEAFVFDATSGARLTGVELHPGMSTERIDRLARLVHHDDIGLPVHGEGPVNALHGDPDALPSVIPTEDGAKVLWLDYAAFLSSLELSDRWVNVPWEVVRVG